MATFSNKKKKVFNKNKHQKKTFVNNRKTLKENKKNRKINVIKLRSISLKISKDFSDKRS